MNRKWMILWLLIALLLTACGGNAEEPVAVEITETATLIPSATHTLAPTASPTITPTATITPTPTPSYQVLGPDNVDDWEIEEIECDIGYRCQLVDFLPDSYQVVFASQLEESSFYAQMGEIDLKTGIANKIDLIVPMCWWSADVTIMTNWCSIGEVPMVNLLQVGKSLVFTDDERNTNLLDLEDGEFSIQLPPFIVEIDPYGEKEMLSSYISDFNDPIFFGVNDDATRLIQISGTISIVQIWSLEKQELLFEFEDKVAHFQNLVVIPKRNEAVIVSAQANGKPNTAIVYDLETGIETILNYPFFQQDWVRDFVFTDDGSLGAARISPLKRYPFSISIGNLETGEIMHHIDLDIDGDESGKMLAGGFQMVFSPNNQWLFVDIVYAFLDIPNKDDPDRYVRYLKILDVQSGEFVAEFEVPVAFDPNIVISDDGKFIVIEGGLEHKIYVISAQE